MSVVDTDILKPDTGALHISRPIANSSQGTSEESGITTPGSGGDSQPKSPKIPIVQYTEPVSEGEEDEEMDVIPAGEEVGHLSIL